jgi:hypothetical protein
MIPMISGVGGYKYDSLSNELASPFCHVVSCWK